MSGIERRVASRRRILAGLASSVMAGGAALLAGGPARAITARPKSDYGAVLDAACGASADHQRQIAELERRTGLALPDSQLVALLRRTSCPSCGCPLAAPADEPGAF